MPPAAASWPWACCGRRRKGKGGGAGAGASGREGDQWTLFIDLPVLEAATAGFSDGNLLGRGGFGPVYKGVMAGGQEIAVKRLSLESRQGVREFLNEVRLLLKVQHRNLVSLLGCCAAAGHKMLVYPYFPNGSLDHILFDREKRVQLDWPKRYQIILGLAKGPPLPPRRVSGEDHPQGHQGEQRAPRREAEPEDLGFRHGEALPRRRHARQHVQDLWHIWLYGPRVRDERLPVDQDRRFQLRDARAGDRQREEEHRPASRRRESRPVKSYMEAVRGRAVTGDRGPGPVRLGRRRGGDVRPARAAVLPGHRVRAAGHVQRAPHALQRLLHAAQAREAGDPRTGRPVEEHHRLGVQLRLQHEHEQHVHYRHDEGLGAGKHC